MGNTEMSSIDDCRCKRVKHVTFGHFRLVNFNDQLKYFAPPNL